MKSLVACRISGSLETSGGQAVRLARMIGFREKLDFIGHVSVVLRVAIAAV